MGKLTDNFEVEITFDYECIPGEKATRWEPGCDEEVLITRVMVGNTELDELPEGLELLLIEAALEHEHEAYEAYQECKAEANYEARMERHGF